MANLLHKFDQQFQGSVCGIDEVGRGPLSGPVLACAAIVTTDIPDEILNHIQDSKKLTVKRRESLVEDLKPYVAIGTGQASVDEIDRVNILQATYLAMKRAYLDLNKNADYVLVDGNRLPNFEARLVPVIKGDQKSLSIAIASIYAKVQRDKIMADLALIYPHYAWDKNAGYGTVVHFAAIEKYGITEHHRRSFAPIKQMVFSNSKRA